MAVENDELQSILEKLYNAKRIDTATSEPDPMELKRINIAQASHDIKAVILKELVEKMEEKEAPFIMDSYARQAFKEGLSEAIEVVKLTLK